MNLGFKKAAVDQTTSPRKDSRFIVAMDENYSVEHDGRPSCLKNKTLMQIIYGFKLKSNEHCHL